MSRLDARLLKLERLRPVSKLPPEAVFEAPLPSEDLDSWARSLLDEFGVEAPCLAIVKEADARKVIVSRSMYDDLDWGQQSLVLRANEGPHVLIWFAADGLFAVRHNDQADAERWRLETEREFAQAGYRVD